MDITINGDPKSVPDVFTVGKLIDMLNLTGKRFAIEVNMEIVPRSKYATHRLRAGDSIEVVEAIGGG